MMTLAHWAIGYVMTMSMRRSTHLPGTWRNSPFSTCSRCAPHPNSGTVPLRTEVVRNWRFGLPARCSRSESKAVAPWEKAVAGVRVSTRLAGLMSSVRCGFVDVLKAILPALEEAGVEHPVVFLAPLDAVLLYFLGTRASAVLEPSVPERDFVSAYCEALETRERSALVAPLVALYEARHPETYYVPYTELSMHRSQGLAPAQIPRIAQLLAQHAIYSRHVGWPCCLRAVGQPGAASSLGGCVGRAPSRVPRPRILKLPAAVPRPPSSPRMKWGPWLFPNVPQSAKLTQRAAGRTSGRW